MAGRKPHNGPILGHALLAALPLLAAVPVAAEVPVWQPAIQCAALDSLRAERMALVEAPLPDWLGTPEDAQASAQTYLRIVAEALDCPARAEVDALLYTVQVGVLHRLAVAESWGHGPEVQVLPMASETELTCVVNLDPDLIETARESEGPICGWDE